jgi:hypothetical protein
MAYELVELIHALCVRPAWANLVAKWITQRLSHVDPSFMSSFIPLFSSPLTAHEPEHRRRQQQTNAMVVSQDAVVAMALLGGLYDSIRVGGQAQVVENSVFGVASERVVVLERVLSDGLGRHAATGDAVGGNNQSSGQKSEVGY